MKTSLKSSSAIPRQSLTSAVADKLRDKIVRGEIQEGEQLRQDAIASQFQVSRVPVREALRHLEAEGLIEIVAHHGAVVSSLSPDEIGDLFDIRALLESEVLKESIPNLTEEDFREAERVLSTYERILERSEEVGEWGHLNWQFHSALYAGAHRPYFMGLIRTLNNNGDRYTRLHLYLTGAIQNANKEHRNILELCRARNAAAACEALQTHIRSAGRSLKEFVKASREKGARPGLRGRSSAASAE